MRDIIDQLIIHYQYFGLFIGLAGGIIGLPIPDEVLLTFVGYNITLNRMDFTPSLLTSFGGAIFGITLSYLLGAILGLPFLHKYGSYIGINEKRITYVHDLFDKWGGLLLFFGYFIPGVRSVTAFIAAVSGMNWVKFAMFAYAGAVVWCTTFILLGEHVGKEWYRVEALFQHYRNITLLVLLAIVIIWIGTLLYKAHKKRDS